MDCHDAAIVGVAKIHDMIHVDVFRQFPMPHGGYFRLQEWWQRVPPFLQLRVELLDNFQGFRVCLTKRLAACQAFGNSRRYLSMSYNVNKRVVVCGFIEKLGGWQGAAYIVVVNDLYTVW